MSLDYQEPEHDCDDCYRYKEPDVCLCDSCLESRLEAEYNKGKDDGIEQALSE